MLPMPRTRTGCCEQAGYRMGEIHRGDVVVFCIRATMTKSYIKRVIALPATICGSSRGKCIERQRGGGGLCSGAVHGQRSQADTMLPPNDYWLMGTIVRSQAISRDFDRGTAADSTGGCVCIGRWIQAGVFVG